MYSCIRVLMYSISRQVLRSLMLFQIFSQRWSSIQISPLNQQILRSGEATSRERRFFCSSIDLSVIIIIIIIIVIIIIILLLLLLLLIVLFVISILKSSVLGNYVQEASKQNDKSSITLVTRSLQIGQMKDVLIQVKV
jgi:hypothetical protein